MLVRRSSGRQTRRRDNGHDVAYTPSCRRLDQPRYSPTSYAFAASKASGGGIFRRRTPAVAVQYPRTLGKQRIARRRRGFSLRADCPDPSRYVIAGFAAESAVIVTNQELPLMGRSRRTLDRRALRADNEAAERRKPEDEVEE